MSGGELKLIALILMTLDHIGVFFPNSPIWFRYLGRLAAPIFFLQQQKEFTIHMTGLVI